MHRRQNKKEKVKDDRESRKFNGNRTVAWKWYSTWVIHKLEQNILVEVYIFGKKIQGTDQIRIDGNREFLFFKKIFQKKCKNKKRSKTFFSKKTFPKHDVFQTLEFLSLKTNNPEIILSSKWRFLRIYMILYLTYLTKLINSQKMEVTVQNGSNKKKFLFELSPGIVLNAH